MLNSQIYVLHLKRTNTFFLILHYILLSYATKIRQSHQKYFFLLHLINLVQLKLNTNCLKDKTAEQLSI